MQGEKTVIVIEGIIGVGKTTLGNFLSEELQLDFYRELSSPSTLDFLNKFYADKQRWSFALQIHFLNQRFHMIKDVFKNKGGILDRSIFGDRIFADMLYKDGDMSKEEYETYYNLFDNMMEHAKKPQLMIYLDANIDLALHRIKERNRGLENTIPKKYLENLNERYLEWFDQYDHSPKIKLDYNIIDIKTEIGREKVKGLLSSYKKS